MLFIIGLYSSCAKMEEIEPVPVVKIENKEYSFNMPVMSADTDVIKAYLAKVGASMTEERDGDIVKIVADIATSQKDLFSRVEYTFKYNGNQNSFLNVNLSYNNINPDLYAKLYVTSYLSDACIFDMK